MDSIHSTNHEKWNWTLKLFRIDLPWQVLMHCITSGRLMRLDWYPFNQAWKRDASAWHLPNRNRINVYSRYAWSESWCAIFGFSDRPSSVKDNAFDLGFCPRTRNTWLRVWEMRVWGPFLIVRGARLTRLTRLCRCGLLAPQPPTVRQTPEHFLNLPINNKQLDSLPVVSQVAQLKCQPKRSPWWHRKRQEIAKMTCISKADWKVGHVKHGGSRLPVVHWQQSWSCSSISSR